ncbi:Nicotinamide/nicotinic acid mononucleotide adenylyltransferase 2 [Dissophora globulifera]|nr:Nicotinamide/nicotinic acid mononucleotide adenylyltransferase 2 [Dissophora globulifera]
MLEAAKIRMEQELGERGSESAIILGGFLSPSHDLYVGEKLKGEDLVLNSKERLDLCRLQTAQSDWIDVDPWESSQKEFFAYSKVTSRLQQYLQEQCQPTLERRMQALLLPQEHTNSSQHTLLNNSQQKSCFAQMVPQGSGSLTLDSTRNPSNIRVVYLCGADFVLRTGARKLIGGIVVVDRPLGAPSSNRRSILLTNSGGSISVPVSTQLDKDEEDDFASLASTSPSSVSSLSSNSSSSSTSSTTTTVITTAKQRVFRQLTQSYGSDWCESNVWWLPARSRTESEDISSTRIRGLLSDRKSCDGLLHPAVAARLLEKKARQEAA